jgi:DNA-binding NarL/FixJ family response regulator
MSFQGRSRLLGLLSEEGREVHISGEAPTRLFLLDDHEIVRRGLRDLFESEPDLEVVGESGSAAQAVPMIRTLTPDVALLDARLLDGDGIEVCRSVRSTHPGVRTMILTSYDDDEALFAAIMAGASGYLLKQIRGPELVDAVRRVAAGQSLLDPAVTSNVLDRVRSRAARSGDLASLSDREHEILLLIAEGLTNRQIAARLFIAEKTAKNHVSNLLGKLGVERRTQAALLAARLRR